MGERGGLSLSLGDPGDARLSPPGPVCPGTQWVLGKRCSSERRSGHVGAGWTLGVGVTCSPRRAGTLHTCLGAAGQGGRGGACGTSRPGPAGSVGVSQWTHRARGFPGSPAGPPAEAPRRAAIPYLSGTRSSWPVAAASPPSAGHELFFHFSTGTNRSDKTLSDEGRTGIDKSLENSFSANNRRSQHRVRAGRRVGVRGWAECPAAHLLGRGTLPCPWGWLGSSGLQSPWDGRPGLLAPHGRALTLTAPEKSQQRHFLSAPRSGGKGRDVALGAGLRCWQLPFHGLRCQRREVCRPRAPVGSSPVDPEAGRVTWMEGGSQRGQGQPLQTAPVVRPRDIRVDSGKALVPGAATHRQGHLPPAVLLSPCSHSGTPARCLGGFAEKGALPVSQKAGPWDTQHPPCQAPGACAR